MDILFKNVWVVTVDENNTVLKNGVVRVAGNKISYVGTEVPDDLEGVRVIDGKGKKLLMPGFVDAHTHIPMVLFRGGTDDLDLHTWLNTRIFPMEAKETPESITLGTYLALAEMVRGGVTTVNDMYMHNRDMMPAWEHLPVRATLSMCLVGQLPNWREQIADCVSFHHEYNHSFDGLVRVALGPHAEYTATVPFLEKCADTARELHCPLHIHVSETMKEHEECKQRYGVTPVGLLNRVGFFGENQSYLAHCVWLDESDMELVGQSGAAVLHNPCSNMKLGSGFAPIPRMLEKGLRIALATDGASSNNNLDMWEEMRLCALMHKGKQLDATVLPAPTALYLATRGGALALGYEDVGSIKEGFQADMILVDIDRPYFHPMTNIVHHIVYGGNSRDVEMTLCAGRILYEKGQPFSFDLDYVYERVQDLYDNLFNA